MYAVKHIDLKTGTTCVAHHRNEVSAIVAAAELERYLESKNANSFQITRENLPALHTNSLMLEVGRYCNLQCEHCLRGEAQNIKMPFDVAKAAINQFDSIGTISFTGGEPALYGKEIKEIVDYIIATDVEVGSFYVATNGTVLSWDLIDALIRLYAHCYIKNDCQLDISNDHWHEWDVNYTAENYEIYEALAFTNKKGDFTENHLVHEGNAAENGWGNRFLKTTYPFDYDLEYRTVNFVYINAKGGILPDCDYSYKTQDEMKPYNIQDITSGKISITDIFEKYNKEDKENVVN